MRSKVGSGKLYFVLFFLCLAGVLCVMPRLCQAGEASGNLMIIFDASGSMWGQMKGKAKITIAKKVLTDLVKSLPADLNVGLVAYGHRRKGDCDDVQTLSPLAELDKKKLIGLIKNINPKGKTPMIRSIKKTADKLKNQKQQTTIILISDGKETCDPDPCGFVRSLRKSKIKFVMHVIGFGVSGQVDKELACMAKAGKGEYYPATSALKLKKSLNKVVEKSFGMNLIVSGFDSKDKPISVRVRAYDQAGKEIDTNAGKNAGLSLPFGIYNLTIKAETLGQVKTIKGVKIVKGKVTKRRVVFAKAKIRVLLTDEKKKPVKGYIRIVNLKNGQYIDQGDITGKVKTFEVSPGKYQVISECSNTGAKIKSDPFELKPKEQKTIQTACVKAGIGVLVKNAKGKPVIAYIRIVDVAKDSYAEQADSKKKMSFFEVPPGKYYVDIECPGPDAKRLKGKPFILKPGSQVIREVICK